MDGSEKSQEVMERCDLCGDYEGTKAQIRGHRPRCRERKAKEAAEAIKASQPEAEVATESPEPAVETEPVVLAVKEDAPPELKAVVEQAATREREIPDRKERVPLGVRREKLSAPTRDGFHRRWMNDDWNKDPNRVAAAEAGGYTHVEGMGPRVVGSNDSGKPIIARLMEIPQELYDEDQAAKAKEIDEKEKLINEGSFDEKPGDNRYVPSGAANSLPGHGRG